MNKLIQKIRSRRGETLVETLCAVLIFTMASIAMFSMVMSAAKINQTAKAADAELQNQLLVVETADGASSSGKITMTMSQTGVSGDLATINVTVDVYQSGDLFSYFRAGGG